MNIRFFIVIIAFLACGILQSAALAQPGVTDDSDKAKAPVAVGALAEEADIVFWFVILSSEIWGIYHPSLR